MEFGAYLKGFDASGLNVNNNNDNENNGLAPSRNFCCFPPLERKFWLGDGFYPAANHLPDLLKSLLYRNVLLIVDYPNVF